MQKITKILSLVLALMLLGSLMPLAADAVVDLDLTAPRVEELGVQINPLYQGVISESEIDLPEFRHDPSRLGADATVNYQTIEQAGAQLRKYMIDRAETFTIYVKANISPARAVAERMLAVAFTHTGAPTAGDYIAWHYEGFNAQVSSQWLDGGYCYTFEFAMSYMTTAAQEAEMTRAVNQLLRNLNVSGKSDYEKVRAVYDYMCENITYDHTSSGTLKHSAYAALVNKTAVCQGYASLFYRLMLELGVDNRLMPGLAASGEAHGWNIVEVDGLYYNVDATWDAGVDDYNYFLRNSWNFVGHYRFLDYETIEYHNAYPMAAEDYSPGTTATKDPIIYIGAAGEEALYGICRDGTLLIFGQGETYDYFGNDYETNGAPWNYWKADINALVVEEGITRLGEDLCYSMPGLKSVTLPESLICVGDSAFRGCYKLESVHLSEGLLEIENYAFNGCSALSKIEFPSTLTTLGSSAFSQCNSLTTLTLPKSITEMSHAFSNCNNLTKVYLRCKVVGNSAFYGCEKLTKVYMYNSVETIGGSAFQYCTALETIDIPKGVTCIKNNAFYGCSNLKTVYFKGDAPEITDSIFEGVTATAWYPDGNNTWTADAMEVCGGDITWKAKKELKITQQPEDGYAVEGSRATVTVKAQGNDLTYKWYFKDAGASKFSLTTSFTGNKYYISMSDARDGRQVYCVITDAHGKSVTTDTVTLHLVTETTILAEPADAQVKLGATAKATVKAVGKGLTYQWYVKDVGAASFTKSSNTTATYAYKMTEAKTGRQAYCIVKDADGNSIQTRTVTFGLAATIVKQPADVTVHSGERATVTIKAAGDGLTYKWYYKDTGASKFYLTNTFKGNKYYITMNDARNGRQVYCVITDQYGNKVTTKTVTLGMPKPVAIVTEPADAQAKLGATARTTVTASGDDLIYQWYVKDVGDSAFTKSSNTTATYSYKMTAAKNGRQAYCVITDVYGTQVQTRTVTFGMAVTLLEQPEDVTVASGEKATVQLNVVGDGLTYQWYYKDEHGYNFTLTTSFTGSKYYITMTNARANRQIYCVITDQYGNSVTTNTVTLKME